MQWNKDVWYQCCTIRQLGFKKKQLWYNHNIHTLLLRRRVLYMSVVLALTMISVVVVLCMFTFINTEYNSVAHQSPWRQSDSNPSVKLAHAIVVTLPVCSCKPLHCGMQNYVQQVLASAALQVCRLIFNVLLSWVHHVIQREQPTEVIRTIHQTTECSMPAFSDVPDMYFLLHVDISEGIMHWRHCAIYGWRDDKWKKRAQHCVLLDADEKSYRYRVEHQHCRGVHYSPYCKKDCTIVY